MLMIGCHVSPSMANIEILKQDFVKSQQGGGYDIDDITGHLLEEVYQWPIGHIKKYMRLGMIWNGSSNKVE